MSLHLTFNNMRQSEAVSAHIHNMFEELIKITDNKFPFHVRLNKEGDETYHVGINCNYHSKQLVSNVDDSNLCLLYTSPSPRDQEASRMPSSA